MHVLGRMHTTRERCTMDATKAVNTTRVHYETKRVHVLQRDIVRSWVATKTKRCHINLSSSDHLNTSPPSIPSAFANCNLVSLTHNIMIILRVVHRVYITDEGRRLRHHGPQRADLTGFPWFPTTQTRHIVRHFAPLSLALVFCCTRRRNYHIRTLSFMDRQLSCHLALSTPTRVMPPH